MRILQVLGKAVTGDVFGEIGVLCYRPQPFSVQTTEVSQILRLTSTSLVNIMQVNKEDGHVIMNNLSMVIECTLGYITISSFVNIESDSV